MAGIEGLDGRLYYHYGLGAEYEIGNRGARVQIVECFMQGEEESYYLERYGRGDSPLGLLPMTLGRLTKYLEIGKARGLDAGEPRELPLLAEEVEYYVREKARERKEAESAAERILYDKKNGGAEYAKLVASQRELEKALGRAIAESSMEAKRLKPLYETVCEKRRSYVREKGVNGDLFMPERKCTACAGQGFVSGRICDCMVQRQGEIKRIAAAYRLEKRLGKEWYSVPPAPRSEKEAEAGLIEDNIPPLLAAANMENENGESV